MMNIHAEKETGEILSWGSASAGVGDGDDSHFPAHAVLVLDDYREVDPRRDKVDWLARAVVAKSSEEIAAAHLPREAEIRGLILREMEATDGFVDPPSDRPLKGALLLDWEPYREALRGLRGDAAAMLAGWPVRPDKRDAAANLRAVFAAHNKDKDQGETNPC
jgi:hypothetical protein